MINNYSNRGSNRRDAWSLIRWSCLLLLLFCSTVGFTQSTTITTAASPLTNSSGSGTVTFNFNNTNGYPVLITSIEGIVGTAGATSADFWYKTTPVSGTPGAISTGNGWTLAATGTFTGVANTTTLTTQTFLSGLSVIIPAGANYGFAISAYSGTTGRQRYSTMTAGQPNVVFSGGGVTITMGDNISYAGGAPPTAPTNSPRGWLGKITFQPQGPCTNPPVPGTVTSTANPACPNTNFTLGISGGTGGTGQTYQWEVSPNNISYTPISGATSVSLVTSQVSSNYYRCQITCGTTVPTAPLLVNTTGSPLNGTYTVNSALPTSGTNYQTFSALAADLACLGVSGPVTVNVAAGSGPYNEQPSFAAIPGSSAINTVTINGNNTTITNAGGAEYQTLKMNGADYMTWNNVNITTTGATSGFAILLTNGSDYNNFNTCTFNASTTSTGTGNSAVAISGSTTSALGSGTNGNNNTFTGCTMTGGYYCVSVYGNSAANTVNNQFINCTIQEYYVYGLYNVYNTGTVVRGCTFQRPTRTSVSTGYGVYLTTSSSNCLIERNRVTNLYGGAPTSTSTTYCLSSVVAASVGNENKFYNNIIHDIKSAGIIYGLYLSGGSNVLAYHNTISLDHTGSTATGATYGIYSTGSSVDIRNNIVTISRGGTGTKYCLYYSGGTQVSNNNVLLNTAAAGTNYIGYFSTGFATLSAWQAANGGVWDGASMNVSPAYSSPGTGDFTPTNTSLNNTGANVGVANDFYGTARTLATPDPGAVEFTVLGLDASIGWVSPTSPAVAGSHSITVNIVNTQSTTITSLELYYSDGVNPAVTETFTGLNILPSGNQNFTFTVPYTLSASVTMTAGINLVNGVVDNNTSNNTINYTLCIGLSGTYTINSALPTSGTNYQTFAAAVSAMSCGIAGPVTFNVAAGSGPYNEQISIPVIIGSSAVNTITINGNNNTLTSAGGTDYHTLRLNGADYLTVNNLNVVTTGATSGFALLLSNSADNNNFNNCTFTASTTSTGTTNAAVAFSASTTSAVSSGNNGNNNTFTGCTMTGGYYCISHYGASGNPNLNNKFYNNTAKEFYTYGIYNVYNTGTIISGNIVERPTRTGVSTCYAIYLSTSSVGATVEKNHVRRLFGGAPTSTSSAYCLYIASSSTAGNEHKIQNNVISDIVSAGLIYCIYNTGASYSNIYHNTIDINDPSNTSSSTLYGIYNSGTAGVNIRDNIVTLNRGGSGTKYNLYISSVPVSCNNNNLYNSSVGGTPAIGYYLAAYTTLANWQTANAGAWDQQSSSLDPGYLDPANFNYRPTNVALDNTGVNVGVLTDRNGTARSVTTPDMGAYEFTISPIDAGAYSLVTPVAATSACYSNAETITVRIRNYGLNPVDFSVNPATVTCNVTGAATATLTGTPTGILAYNGTMDVVMSSTLDMTALGTYTINASISLTGDGDATNDAMNAASRTTAATLGSISSDVQTICVSGAPTLTIAGAVGTIQWQESIVGSSGPWSNVGTNAVTYTPASSITDTTWYRAIVTCNTFNDSTNVVEVDLLMPQILTTTNDTVCGAGNVTLSATATGQGTINWFAVPAGGTAVATGSSYSTYVTSQDTFYVEEQLGSGGSQTSPLLISEIDVGTNDQLEIQNVSPNSLNITGWKVAVSNSYTDITSVNANIQTLSGTLAPGAILTWIDVTGSNYWGSNILWNPGAYPSFTGWAAIIDNNNVLRDIVFMNWPSSVISTASITIGSNTYTVGSLWSGDGINITSVAGTQSLSRVGNLDNNTLSDFSVINLSIGSANPGLSLPMDGFGCPSVRVPVYAISIAPPAITLTPSATLCGGDSIELLVSSVNDPNYVYTWTSNPSGYTNSGNGPFWVTPASSTTYYLSASDASTGCLLTDSVVVGVVPVLAAGTVAASQSELCVSGTITATVTGASGGLQWQTSTVSGNGPWTNVGVVNSTTYNAGTVTQTTYFRVLASCSNNVDSSNVDTVIVNNPQIVSSLGATRCGPGTLDLQATANPGSTVYWYSAATGGSSLDTGATFTTPFITASTDYYAEAVAGNPPAVGGRLTNVAGSALSGFPRGIIFNATEAVTIDSVGFMCSGIASAVTVQLYNSTGTATVGSPVIVNIPANAGTSTVPVLLTFPVNIQVPAAGTYRLFVTAIAPTGNVLWYEFSGVTGYPYAVGNKVSITSSVTSLTGAASLTTYYYFYKLVVGSGCVNPVRTLVSATVTPSPAVALAASNDTLCYGDSTNLTVTLGTGDYTNFDWVTSTGAVAGSGTSIWVKPLATTKYYMLSSGNVGNCQALDSITIVVNNFSLSVSVNNPMICGVSDSAQVTTTASGGTFSYLWSPGLGVSSVTNPNVKIRPAGSSETDTLYVTNSVTGCVKIWPVTTYKSAPAVLTVSGDSICGTGQVTVSATGTTGGQISWWSASANGTRLAVGPTFTPTISSTTKYYVEVRDTIAQTPVSTGFGGGTTATDPNAAGNMFDITAVNNIRITGFDVHLDTISALQPSNIAVYYKSGTYSGFTTNPTAWTLAGTATGVVSAGRNVPTSLPLNLDIPIKAGQTYGFYIVVTNLGVANSIVYTGSANSPAEGAVAAADYNMQVKSGTVIFGPFTGQVGTPVNRLWNGRVNYTIGCISSRDSVTAVSSLPPVVTLTTSEDTVCLGSSATLNASSVNDPNYSYVWNPGSNAGSSYVVTPSGTTKYYLTATDTSSGGYGGCVYSDSITIRTHLLPTVDATATSTLICSGDSVTITAIGSTGSPDSTTLTTPTLTAGNSSSAVGFDITNTSASPITIDYFWFTSSATAGTSLTESVYYSTTPMNCTFPTNVTTAPGWTLIGSATTTSAGTAPNLTLIPLDLNITIPPGATYAFAFGGSSVAYSNGTSGCPSVVSDANINLKEGFGGTLTGTIAARRFNGRVAYSSPTAGALNYAWTPAIGLSNPSVSNPKASPALTTTYTVTATNTISGCTATDTITINVNVPAQPYIATGDTTLCAPNVIQVRVKDSGPYSGGYPSGTTFEWFTVGGQIVPPTPDLDSIPSSFGSTYYTILTLPNGCTARSDTANILTKAVAVVDTIVNASCSGSGSILATVTSGLPPYNYVWSTDPAQTNIIRNVTSSFNKDTLTGLAAGTYYLNVADESGSAGSCNSGVITLVVGGSSPIVISLDNLTTPLCNGTPDGSATISYTGGTAPISVLWSTGATTNSIAGLVAGTYTVTVSDNFGCADTLDVIVTEPALLTATLSSTPESGVGAADGTVTAVVSGGTPGYSIDWYDLIPNYINSGSTIGSLGAGFYQVFIQDANACQYLDTVEVTVTSNMTLNLTLLIEGMYDGAGGLVPALLYGGVGTSSTECDTIHVELRDQTSPTTVLGSGTVVLGTNGQASLTLPSTAIGATGYIAVFHRNAVETWSDLVTFSATTNYNFTTAASQAYGSNQKEVATGVWAFYSGDLSPQDGLIDVTDQGLIDNDIFNFVSGYVVTDITGDNLVDVTDQGIVDNNIFNFIGSLHP